MGQLLYAIIKTARPRQWIKSLAVFTVLLFTGNFFDGNLFGRTLLASMSLSLLSSSNYIFNDILEFQFIIIFLHPLIRWQRYMCIPCHITGHNCYYPPFSGSIPVVTQHLIGVLEEWSYMQRIATVQNSPTISGNNSWLKAPKWHFCILAKW